MAYIYKTRDVTIFGGSGFIGRSIVQRLAREGARIRVAVRRPLEAEALKPLGNIGQIVPIQANIRDDASVRRAVAGADWVINLVGILFANGKQTFEAVQAGGAGRVAKAAREAGVERLLQMSAIGADPKSDSAYARSKAQGEETVKGAFPDATILRPSIVFGPEDDFFNRFAALAEFSPFLPLIGGGKTRFQPVYVGDVADAALAALHDPDTQGKTYELGGPLVYSFKELLEFTLETSGRKRPLLNIPFGLARLQGMLLGLLPKPPLTADQVTLLQHDNVVAENALGLADLGLSAHTVETIVPTYLWRFRPSGRWYSARHRVEG